MTDQPDIHTDIAEMIRIAGEDWADKDAAAFVLAESKTALLENHVARYMADNPGVAHSRATASVKGSEQWLEHIDSIGRARKEANKARVHYDTLRSQLTVWQTRNSLKRAEQWSNRGT